MKSIFIAAAAALVVSTGSALAWEGKTVACYAKVYVEPTYKTNAHKVLVKPAKQQYEHRNGRVELVHYAPVYREVTKTVQTSKGYWLMREVACTPTN